MWADAAIQIFFSLGPGWGGIVNMASYNQFRNNNRLLVLNFNLKLKKNYFLKITKNFNRDSIFVPILNCSTSIFAGFVVFSVLGFMAHKTGLPVSSVATGGEYFFYS